MRFLILSSMKKFIIETGKTNQILRTKSELLRPSEIKSYEPLMRSMVDYVKNSDNNSAGLAAPQVGVNKRFVAVSLIHHREDENYRTIIMINPVILEHSDDRETDYEGCLSLPKEFHDVIRWTHVKVSFLDIS